MILDRSSEKFALMSPSGIGAAAGSASGAVATAAGGGMSGSDRPGLLDLGLIAAGAIGQALGADGVGNVKARRTGPCICTSRSACASGSGIIANPRLSNLMIDATVYPLYTA